MKSDYMGAAKFSRELGISEGVLYKALKILHLDHSDGFSGYTEAQKEMILNCDCVKTYLKNKKIREENERIYLENLKKQEQEEFEKANNHVTTQRRIRYESDRLCFIIDRLNQNLELFIDLFRYNNGINAEEYEDFKRWQGDDEQDE